VDTRQGISTLVRNWERLVLLFLFLSIAPFAQGLNDGIDDTVIVAHCGVPSLG
jgi:hypothetical protein